jgi:hypothetical protein
MPMWLANIRDAMPVTFIAAGLVVVAILLALRLWRGALAAMVALLAGVGAFLAAGARDGSRGWMWGARI